MPDTPYPNWNVPENQFRKQLIAFLRWLVASGTSSTSGIAESIFDAKGDLIAASAANTAVRLPVGSDYQALFADSDATAGVAWKYPCFINAKHYGATGDGTTDDRPALQEAINAAQSVHGTLYLPVGIYAIDGSLHITSGLRILGAGSMASYLRAQTASDPCFEIVTDDQVILEHIRIDGLGASRDAGSVGIHVTAPAGVVSNFVRINDVTLVHHQIGIDFEKAQSWIVSNSTIYHRDDEDAIGIKVRNTQTADQGDSGIYHTLIQNGSGNGNGYCVYQSSSGGLRIQGCKFLSSEWGYYGHFEGVTSVLLLTGNSIETQNGIYLAEFGGSISKVSITGNELAITGTGILIGPYVEEGTIVGNYIQGTTDSEGIVFISGESWMVEGNVFASLTGTAIIIYEWAEDITLGLNHYDLGAGGTTISDTSSRAHYATPSDSRITAKGDLFTGASADLLTKTTVGSNNTVLTADSAQDGGVKWSSVDDLLGITNVKFYGATGDGETDDTDAIAAAYTAAPSGGTLYFPPGTYCIDTGITVAKPLRIIGCGRDHSILKMDAAATGPVIAHNYAGKLIIQDIGITSASARTGANAYGIILYHSATGTEGDGVTLRDITVRYQNVGIRSARSGTYAYNLRTEYNASQGVWITRRYTSGGSYSTGAEQYWYDCDSHANEGDGFCIEGNQIDSAIVGVYLYHCWAASNYGSGFRFIGDVRALRLTDCGTAHNYCNQVTGHTGATAGGFSRGGHNILFTNIASDGSTDVLCVPFNISILGGWFESAHVSGEDTLTFCNIRFDASTGVTQDVVINGIQAGIAGGYSGGPGLYFGDGNNIIVSNSQILGGSNSSTDNEKCAIYLKGEHISLNNVITTSQVGTSGTYLNHKYALTFADTHPVTITGGHYIYDSSISGSAVRTGAIPKGSKISNAMGFADLDNVFIVSGIGSGETTTSLFKITVGEYWGCAVTITLTGLCVDVGMAQIYEVWNIIRGSGAAVADQVITEPHTSSAAGVTIDTSVSSGVVTFRVNNPAGAGANSYYTAVVTCSQRNADIAEA